MALTSAKVAFEGASVSYLAKAVAGSFPNIDQVKGVDTPKFAGDPAAYLTKYGDNDSNKRLLTNKVKKCSNCGKPNAFTLDRCNACGTSLIETAISFSNNVFMGFAFGIQKGPFPFTVSIRHQTPEFLVMDDLLALAPLHFNVIPTTQYVPDWRFLLRKPAEGLKLVERMLACCEAATKPFLENKEWCSKMVKGGEFDIKDIACGFNYPPSQYQLHIQYMMPNLMPFQYAQFLKGVHFTYKRFFPVPYVVECLKAAAKEPLPAELLSEDASVNAITDHFAAHHGVDYDKIHGNFMNSFKAAAAKYSNWDAADFEGSVVDLAGTATFASNKNGGEFDADVDTAALVNTDKLVLQNYGRAYAEGNKPTGSYYSYAKEPSDVEQW